MSFLIMLVKGGQMEIEAKFAIPNRKVYQRLAACRELAGYVLAPTGTIAVVDRYFDTPDGRLLEAGYTCRLRTVGGGVIATLKSIGGVKGAIHQRDEQEVQLPSWTPEVVQWPDSAVRTLALTLTGGAKLEPLFELSQKRERANVMSDERRIAELSLDAVKASLGQRPTRYYELEIELMGKGAESDLRKLADELLNGWGLAPEKRSKFQRAFDMLRNQSLALEARLTPEEREILSAHAAHMSPAIARRVAVVLGWASGLPTREIASRSGLSRGRVRYWLRAFRSKRMEIFRPKHSRKGSKAEPNRDRPIRIEAAPARLPEPPELLPDERMSEAGRKLMYLHFARMVYHEPGTRAGEDPESLHDMRVSTRRMRAAFLLFEPYYDADALAPFGKRLRRTGRALGAVRDLDVLLGKARKWVDTLPEGQACTLDPLLADWEAQRESARKKMIAYLDGGEYRKFKKSFEAFLTTPGAGALPAQGEDALADLVRNIVPGLLFGRYQSVRAYEPLLPNAPLATYHQLRIECKRLRYALEFFRDVLGAEAGSLIKQVTAMQDLLGDLQDASVAEALVGEFLHRQTSARVSAVEPAPLEGVTTYLNTQWSIQRDLLNRFPPLWENLIGYDFRRELGLAIAAL